MTVLLIKIDDKDVLLKKSPPPLRKLIGTQGLLSIVKEIRQELKERGLKIKK